MWKTPEKIMRMPSSTAITLSDPVGWKATIRPRMTEAAPMRKEAFHPSTSHGAVSGWGCLTGTLGFHLFPSS